MAETFSEPFGYAGFGYVLGMLHDKGKEKTDFQKYIRSMSGLADSHLVWENKDHAYVGALLSKRLYPQSYPLLAYPIAGHHAGLADYVDLENTLRKELPKEIADEKALPLSVCCKEKPAWGEMHHLIRMLYSSLVDADYLDTERFMMPEKYAMRGNFAGLSSLRDNLDEHLKRLENTSKDSDVNRLRRDIQQICRETSQSTPGFYSLTVPTGGGKTLASMVWALNHAVRYGMRRVIIAIPYTSIIVQTAQVLKSIFGDENVLEHHSNMAVDDKDFIVNDKKKLATENWDYPIVVTTNVQLFESMYSNRPSQCRKLHNICNSVLILDEAQTLPTEQLQPIVDALKAYQRLFGVSVLFTTASMPVLVGEHRGCNPSVVLNGIDNIREIVPPTFRLHDRLRRVNLHFDKEPSGYDKMADRLLKCDRVLCVVNTRKDAQEIFKRLPKEGMTLHLSKMMCPIHIRKVIERLKSALLSDYERVIRVVSTQLIEAGVDIDFPVVYRQEAGLDSILQAAGRCNREGKMERGEAYVFSLEREHPLPRGHITDAANACKGLGVEASADSFAPGTMERYFEQLYCRTQTFDKGEMKALLGKPFDFCFRTAAERFRLIEDGSVDVIVNYEDSVELIARLREEGPHCLLMRQLAQYSVSIHRRDFDVLKKGGLVEEVLEGIYWLPDREQYKEDTGLTTDNHWLEEILIM